MNLNQIYNEDCLEGMKRISDKSVDMILCDLPYGSTSMAWDSVIPFNLLWEQYERVIKDNGAIVLFGAEPFSSHLRMSKLALYKFDYVWIKSKAQHFAQAPYRPMTKHETISVFSKGGNAKNAKNRMKYFPQGLVSCQKVCKGKKASHSPHRLRQTDQEDYAQEFTNYPTTILQFANEGKTIHPTQKPVSLFEYLIRTYTNEGETVLDNCMGSGTTAIACINTNRKYIGFELDTAYYEVAIERIKNHRMSKGEQV